MPGEIANPKVWAGQFVGEDPTDGIVAVAAGDGTVQITSSWDTASGDVKYYAPAGTNVSGGTRRHLFDGDVYANTGTRGAPVYSNVRAWGSLTGVPTTVQGYGITNAVRSDQNGTITGTLTTSGNIVTGAAATNRTTAYQTAGVNRWDIGAGSIAESGSNAGSNFVVRAYSDAGALLGTAFQIDRATTGNATLSRHHVPSADNAYDNGTSGARWRNLYVSGTSSLQAVTATSVSTSSALPAGTYSGQFVASSGAARSVLIAGVSAVSNGMTVTYDGTHMQYAFADSGSTAAFSGAVTVGAGLTVSSGYSYFGAAGTNGLRLNGSDTSNTIYQPSGTLAITVSSGHGVAIQTAGYVNVTGNLIAALDNGYDIGGNGANRFRNLYLAGNLTTANFAANSNITAGLKGIALLQNQSWLFGFTPGGAFKRMIGMSLGGTVQVDDDAVGTSFGGSVVVGNLSIQQMGAAIGARGWGNALEFGHANQSGYGSSIGYEVSSGYSFIAFHAEAGTTANTYRTRGQAGWIIRSRPDIASMEINWLSSSNADNQTPQGPNIRFSQGATYLGSHLYAITDNSYDIGASGANRPRNVYAAGNISLGGILDVNTSQASSWAAVVINTNLTAPGGLIVETTAALNNTSNLFYGAYDANGATIRFGVYLNGGVANYQANNQNLSDERTKNVGDVIDGAYASRVMADLGRANVWLRYHYKDQTHGDWNLGTTAQRFYNALPEELRPSLVDTEGWTEKDGSARWSVYETDISYLTRAAVSHHANVIDRHESEIGDLRQRVDTLEGEFAAMRKAA